MKKALCLFMILNFVLLVSCSKMKDQAKQITENTAKGTAEIIRSTGKGFKEGFSDIKIKPSETITAKGIIIEYGRKLPDKNVISLYLIFNQSFKGKLRLLAYRKDKKEVGRGTASLNYNKGDAKYIDFCFDPRTPFGIVENYTLDITSD